MQPRIFGGDEGSRTPNSTMPLSRDPASPRPHCERARTPTRDSNPLLPLARACCPLHHSSGVEPDPLMLGAAPPVPPRDLLLFRQARYYLRQSGEFWLPGRDSNPNWRIQSPQSYQLDDRAMCRDSHRKRALPCRRQASPRGARLRRDEAWRSRRESNPLFYRDRVACEPSHSGTLKCSGRPAPIRTGNLRFGDEDDTLSPLACGAGKGNRTPASTLGRSRASATPRPRILERPAGVAPASRVWKTRALLLSYGRE